MNATAKASASVDGADFLRKRSEILAEAQSIDASQVQHRFKPGGSKYVDSFFFSSKVPQSVQEECIFQHSAWEGGTSVLL